jgi:biotin carboxyl carrier protein
MMALHYRSGEVARTARVERQAAGYLVILEGRSFEVTVRRSEGPFLDLLIDGRPVDAIVVVDGDRHIVKVGDADPVTLVRAERAPRAAGQRGALDGRLTAAMDGQVVAVPTKEGDRVEAGATLAVLEAMKMEIRVIAPFPGRVRRLFCAPGDVVERGRVLVDLEPEPSVGSAGPPGS